MPRHLKDILAKRAVERFVGRAAELAALLHILEANGPLVYHLHGIGGIGKSSLLAVFAEQARGKGATVIRLDCRQIEPALPDDGPAIQTITQRHEGAKATTLLNTLWQTLPAIFKALRDRDGEVVGYYIIFDPTEIKQPLRQADPILQNWYHHLQDDPVPSGQRVLFCRRWLGLDHGEAPSVVQAASWLDIKGGYMEMRSTLRRIYCTAVDAAVYAPVLTKLGFQLLPEAAVKLDGQTYHTAMLDFGPTLVTGWITQLVGAELGLTSDDLLDMEARELLVEGERISLTPLEFGVICYLYQREGKAVSRVSLLADVWGYDYQGGSNVVDSVIRVLRKKLGPQSSAIETVTGVGYRLRRR